MKCCDAHGRVKTVAVHANSRNEAAALALEELLLLHRWDLDTNSKIEVTVCEPNSTHLVHPDQILQWAHHRKVGESIGVMALRRRIAEALQNYKPKS